MIDTLMYVMMADLACLFLAWFVIIIRCLLKWTFFRNLEPVSRIEGWILAISMASLLFLMPLAMWLDGKSAFPSKGGRGEWFEYEQDPLAYFACLLVWLIPPALIIARLIYSWREKRGRVAFKRK
jgi:hypothetical protein